MADFSAVGSDGSAGTLARAVRSVLMRLDTFMAIGMGGLTVANVGKKADTAKF